MFSRENCSYFENKPSVNSKFIGFYTFDHGFGYHNLFFFNIWAHIASAKSTERAEHLKN